MDKANFPIEFYNEIDDVKKSENEFYTLAVDRLSKLACLLYTSPSPRD